MSKQYYRPDSISICDLGDEVVLVRQDSGEFYSITGAIADFYRALPSESSGQGITLASLQPAAEDLLRLLAELEEKDLLIGSIDTSPGADSLHPVSLAGAVVSPTRWGTVIDNTYIIVGTSAP